jgi:predicted nucleic acid-binding protein
MADTVLCDTNIVSILLKVAKVHDDRKAEIERGLSGKVALISFVTVAELLYWARQKKWGPPRCEELDRHLRSFAVLDPTRTTAELWAEIKHGCTVAGHQMGQNDLWIAAAAKEYDVCLASSDSDFEHVAGLKRVSL